MKCSATLRNCCKNWVAMETDFTFRLLFSDYLNELRCEYVQINMNRHYMLIIGNHHGIMIQVSLQAIATTDGDHSSWSLASYY